MKKLYFPLCSPSFLRRLVFRLREISPDITYAWTDGYGKTCNDCTTRKVIDLKDNDIVICQPDEMNIKRLDIIDDENSFFDYINNHSNEEELILKKIKKTSKINNKYFIYCFAF